MVVHGGAANSTTAIRIACPDGVAGGPECVTALSAREGFIVAYPNGLASPSGSSRTYNAGGGKGGFGRVSGAACAHSNGAAMASRPACELSDRIAAIRPVGGADQFPAGQGPFVGAKRGIDGWVTRYGCDPAPARFEMPDTAQDGTNVTRYSWSAPGVYYAKAQAADRAGTPPASVNVSQPSVTLEVGQNQKFIAVALDASGVPIPTATIAWSSVGVAGTVDAAGEFTATQEGSAAAEAVATANGGSAEGGAVIIVKRKSAGNDPPATPGLDGPSSGLVGQTLSFTVRADDPDSYTVRFEIDWGDGESTTHDFVNAGAPAVIDHAWDAPGDYVVKARATDDAGARSEWSPGLRVTIDPDSRAGRPVDGPAWLAGPLPWIAVMALGALALAAIILARKSRDRRRPAPPGPPC
jgi:hypothetical protein